MNKSTRVGDDEVLEPRMIRRVMLVRAIVLSILVVGNATNQESRRRSWGPQEQPEGVSRGERHRTGKRDEGRREKIIRHVIVIVLPVLTILALSRSGCFVSCATIAIKSGALNSTESVGARQNFNVRLWGSAASQET